MEEVHRKQHLHILKFSHLIICCNFIPALVTLDCVIELSLSKLVYTISVSEHMYGFVPNMILCLPKVHDCIHALLLSIKMPLHNCKNELMWSQLNCVNISTKYFTCQQPQLTCICTYVHMYVCVYIVTSLSYIHCILGIIHGRKHLQFLRIMEWSWMFPCYHFLSWLFWLKMCIVDSHRHLIALSKYFKCEKS